MSFVAGSCYNPILNSLFVLSRSRSLLIKVNRISCTGKNKGGSWTGKWSQGRLLGSTYVGEYVRAPVSFTNARMKSIRRSGGRKADGQCLALTANETKRDVVQA